MQIHLNLHVDKRVVWMSSEAQCILHCLSHTLSVLHDPHAQNLYIRWLEGQLVKTDVLHHTGIIVVLFLAVCVCKLSVYQK